MVGCVKREELVSWEEVPEGVKLLTFYFDCEVLHLFRISILVVLRLIM